MATPDNTDIRGMFDSNYIGSWDLQGRDVVVTIAKVVAGELPKAGTSTKEKKPIIYFEGKDKGMALNKTNLHTIASIVGSYKVKDWAGKKVTLYATTCSFGRNTVDCIRVRPQAPTGQGRKGPESVPDREPGSDDEAVA